MTNKQLVEEINRAIRGIAINYPPGLEAINRQVQALLPPIVHMYAPDPPELDVPAALPVTPGMTSEPASDLLQPLVRRGPGRPRVRFHAP